MMGEACVTDKYQTGKVRQDGISAQVCIVSSEKSSLLRSGLPDYEPGTARRAIFPWDWDLPSLFGHVG
jgi:hypothetical protein